MVTTGCCSQLLPVRSGTKLGAVEQQIVASHKPFLLFLIFLIKGIYCFDINILRGEVLK